MDLVKTDLVESKIKIDSKIPNHQIFNIFFREKQRNIAPLQLCNILSISDTIWTLKVSNMEGRCSLLAFPICVMTLAATSILVESSSYQNALQIL